MTVKKAELVKESGGQHLFLTMLLGMVPKIVQHCAIFPELLLPSQVGTQLQVQARSVGPSRSGKGVTGAASIHPDPGREQRRSQDSYLCHCAVRDTMCVALCR